MRMSVLAVAMLIWSMYTSCHAASSEGLIKKVYNIADQAGIAAAETEFCGKLGVLVLQGRVFKVATYCLDIDTEKALMRDMKESFLTSYSHRKSEIKEQGFKCNFDPYLRYKRIEQTLEAAASACDVYNNK